MRISIKLPAAVVASLDISAADHGLDRGQLAAILLSTALAGKAPPALPRFKAEPKPAARAKPEVWKDTSPDRTDAEIAADEAAE